MALINITKIDTFDEWRIKTNTLATQVGDNYELLTNSIFSVQNNGAGITNLVDAVNYVVDNAGDTSGLNTDTKTLVGAINEHDAELGDLSGLTTASTTIVGAINEHDAELGDLDLIRVATTDGYPLASSTSDNISNIILDMDTYFDTRVGDISNLYSNIEPNGSDSLTTSHNELWDREDEKYRNTLVLDLTHSRVTEANYTFNTDGTKNQLPARVNTEYQEILSNVRIPSGRTLEVDGTLDISSGTLLVGGTAGTLNITSTFVTLGETNAANPLDGGVIVKRGAYQTEDAPSTGERPDVRIYWDDGAWRWRIKDLDFNSVVSGRLVTTTSGSATAIVNDPINIVAGQYLRGNANIPDFTYVKSINGNTLTLSENAASAGVDVPTDFAALITDTPHIVHSRNIGEYVSTGSTQNGIAVSYNEGTNRLNFDVKDFKITLTGDVTGEATVTNLGDVSIETTVDANKVELGTDTTGAYVKSITLATDSGLSITQSAVGAESNALTEVKVDSTVVRTAGAQTLEGVKTFSDTPVFNAGITVGDASTDTSSFKGDVTFNHNVEVKGNLVVSGTTTTVNSTEVNLADNILLLNSDFVGYPDLANLGTGTYTPPSENVGIKVNRGYSNAVGNPLLAQPELVWDETDDVWKINDASSTYTLVGSIKVDDATLSARTITTTANSKEITTNNYAGIAVGDTVTSDNIPAETFVTSIVGTTKLILSQAATGAGTNTPATFKHVAGMNVSSSGHVTTLEHYTPSSVALDSDNSGGTVLQDVYFDQFGHVKSIGTYNLDNRYYTETESDNRFVNVSGDTMTGNLTMDYYGTTETPGFTQNHTGDGTTVKFYLPYYLDNKDKILSVTVGGVSVADTKYAVSGRFLTLTDIPAANAAIIIKGKAPRVVAGDVVGNSKTSDEALKWSIGRKITLNGDASGNVTIDGSSDQTLTVTVEDDSHNHTTSNIDDFKENVEDIVSGVFDVTHSGLTATYNDATGKIVLNVNDPDITLNGVITGTSTMNNLGNVTITTSINQSTYASDIQKALPRIYNAAGTQIWP